LGAWSNPSIFGAIAISLNAELILISPP